MDPQRVDPITGFFNFLDTLKECSLDPKGAYEKNRATSTNTKLHNSTITVDTCYTADTKLYETGIRRVDIEGKWVIVEQYPNANEAEKGHAKWVKILTEYPDYPLKDIDQWSLHELIEEGETKENDGKMD